MASLVSADTGTAVGWRVEPPPRRWRLYCAALVAASIPFFVRASVLLPETPVPTGFLVALFAALLTANFCILETDASRARAVSGAWGVFFLVGWVSADFKWGEAYVRTVRGGS